QKSIVRNLSVVKERASVGEVTVHSGRIWHPPGVDDIPVEIDEINCPVAIHRRKQSQAGRCPCGIQPAQSDASATDGILVDGSFRLLCGAVESQNSRAGPAHSSGKLASRHSCSPHQKLILIANWNARGPPEPNNCV